MRRSFRQSCGLSIVAILAACGGSDPGSDAESRSSVIGDPLHQAVERAESVQTTVEDRAAELRDRIEASESN